MIVAIGSLNPVKIKGVREAYTSIFGADISVRGIAVESGVSPQPLSLEETIRGAMNRAEEALKVVRDAVHGVGVEAGWIKLYRDMWIDVQVAAILSREGELGIGISSGFLVPPYVVKRVLEDGVEMETAMIELSGIDDIGEKMGAIGFLTRNIVKREDLTREATMMALIPFMPWNRKIYR